MARIGPAVMQPREKRGLWYDHLLMLLKPEIESLMAKSGTDSIELSVWSDCGGMGMEMISMRDKSGQHTINGRF